MEARVAAAMEPCAGTLEPSYCPGIVPCSTVPTSAIVWPCCQNSAQCKSMSSKDDSSGSRMLTAAPGLPLRCCPRR